ncbi:magnesium transporter [bacterium]|nr:magnesium transporter [bacterium]MBU1071653.1 magnesium transporter [bacterium]MBU1674183.1 magnesium transporter [bacterium]
MHEDDRPAGPEESQDDRYLDPSNLEEQWHEYSELFAGLLRDNDNAALAAVAAELSPGDLSEVVRPLSVDDTARVIQLLPTDLASDVLAEIDKRSVTALMELLTIEAIADLIEEMPSDEAADLVGDLDREQAREVLAAMEKEERDEVRELLQYSPDTAGGLMAKEFIDVAESSTCLQAVQTVRAMDENDREGLHFLYVVDGLGVLCGRIPLVEMLLQPWSTPVIDVMERDPMRVDVNLDQEQVAQYVRTHDLVTLPVVDDGGRLVGVISSDDILDVLEDEATEDISLLAGTSEELGETSPMKVARARLPWLLGALLGQIGCVLMMKHFEANLVATVSLTFFIPAIMAMGGNTGIQTSSVVVRGLATGEVNVYHIGRYLLRELATALLTGGLVAAALYVVADLLVGDRDLALVLTISMLSVIVFAAMVGTAVPLLLHRFGIDPAIATGPFITTSNDILAILVYLSMASLLIH